MCVFDGWEHFLLKIKLCVKTIVTSVTCMEMLSEFADRGPSNTAWHLLQGNMNVLITAGSQQIILLKKVNCRTPNTFYNGLCNVTSGF